MSRNPSASYALGHSDVELERLARQAQLIDPITRRFFKAAGVRSGMRVLDVGSGVGDVAFLARDLVGDSGEVVGVDRSDAAVAVARQRAASRGLRNVSFLPGDPADLSFDGLFDAAVGRYVLEWQPDAAHMVRGIAGHVRAGGIVVFHEPVVSAWYSRPPAPTYDRCGRWFGRVLVATGAHPDMGLELHPVFVAAGLGEPAMRMESVVGSGAACADFLRSTAELIRSVTPDLIRLGITTPEEVGIETLADRMIEEAHANGSTIIGRSEVGAWSRVP